MPEPPTHFAPPEKADSQAVARQVQAIEASPIVRRILDSLPTIVLVLNRQRQALYVNRSLLEIMGVKKPDEVLGLRPGEIFQCVHSRKPPAGCGTTEFCRTCGAARAIMESYRGRAATYECRITRRAEGDTVESLDLSVTATPFEADGEQLTIFAVVDISDTKRREMLERIFFHDLSNTANSVLGFAQMLEMQCDEESHRPMLARLISSAQRLNGEIVAQKQLADAEYGRLQVAVTRLESLGMIRQARDAYAGTPLAEGIEIAVAQEAESVEFRSDMALLSRVLGNMLKNAIEASQAGDRVTLDCRRVGDRVEFRVHNPHPMPREVELQVFQRSFSTKGSGRGLGTYSMRLLTERYLGGHVGFTTSETHGTTFRVTYPLAFSGDEPS